MVKKMVKGAGGVFICWTGLIAMVCVPSFVAGVMYRKPCEPVTLLSTTAAATGNAVDGRSATGNPVAALVRIEQSAQLQTAGMHVTTGSDNIQSAGTFLRTQPQPLQLSANRIEAVLCSN